jgi:[NiFe] hydrogenase diaphorase moiety large subunit
MSKKNEAFIKSVCQKHGNDRNRLMEIVRAVQQRCGCVNSELVDGIAECLALPRVEVEGVVTFYAFLSEEPKGKVVIRLCDDVVDELNGVARVAKVFEEEFGIRLGQSTPDGKVTLEWTPCIGMSDQAPAALVNDVVVTKLDTDTAHGIAQAIKDHGPMAPLVKTMGDGNNAHDLIRAMVNNNIRHRGPVIFDPFVSGAALRKALAMRPAEVIRDIKTSRLRGRGGAGFPTGMKWDFARQAAGANRYVLCNADEGEPGTFKDRVILTEQPDLMFEGMTIAGYAIGAENGLVYLRGEYAYLQPWLEHVLAERRRLGLLGRNAGGKEGFTFDITVRMGAGAYICGEETALISSCEGKRGDPKNRPPFPAQKGYLDGPTTVNNVETFCCVARILDQGPGWFAQIGSKGSAGTKLLSISGDCQRPGVYEVPFGIRVSEVLKMAGADKAMAVQVGGPSGRMIGPADFERTICYDDLATGGSLMIFGPNRNVLQIARKFMDFFTEESCGYCTPCRVGCVLMKNKLEDILHGRGEAGDVDYLKELGATMKLMSRCGLGQTAANPVLSTIESFRPAYDAMLAKPGKEDVALPTFDIQAALGDARALIGRNSTVFPK